MASAEILRHWQRAASPGTEHRLQMARSLVYLAAQPHVVRAAQRLLERRAIGPGRRHRDVLVVVAANVRRNAKRLDAESGKPAVVDRGNATAGGDEFLQARKLIAADDRVRFAHAPVVSEQRVKVRR